MKRILLLDDSTDYGIILTLQLRPHGYEVQHQMTVESAIQALQEGSPPDYIFCDFFIGSQSAYDFIEQFKSIRQSEPAPEVVILTNLSPDSPQVLPLQKQGFQTYQKPTRSEQILALVRSLDPEEPRKDGAAKPGSHRLPLL